MTGISDLIAEYQDQRQTILIVDDEQSNLLVMADCLDLYGFSVEKANNGESGLEMARKILPDLILLDVMMSGIDGYETCRLLKADPSLSNIPVLFMTGLNEPGDSVKGFRAGAVDYIPKPFVEQELIARIVTHLRLRDLQQGLEQQVFKRTKELRESEEKWRSLVENVAEAIIATDTSQKIISWNTAAEHIYGWKSEEVIGKSMMDITPTHYHKSDKGIIDDSLHDHGEWKGQTVHWKKDGTAFHVLIAVSVLKDSEGSITGQVSVNLDITERIKSEEELKKHRDNLEELVEARTSELKKANQSLQESLETIHETQGQLIHSEKLAALGQLVAGIAHEINSPLGAIQSSAGSIDRSLQTTLEEFPDFFRNLSPPLQESFIELLKLSVQEEKILTSREQRQAKKKLLDQLEPMFQEKAARITDSLIKMRVFNNLEAFFPLWHSPQWEKTLKLAYQFSRMHRSTQVISTATQRASKIIFALKSYSKVSHGGVRESSQILDGIETVLTLYHNQLKRGITLKCNFGEVPQILCFPDELNQVWINLIQNSLQAMQNKGTLEISTFHDAKWVSISFLDNGPGIPEELHEKVFDPFFTTQAHGEGTGLGLNISQKIVAKHDGHIHLQSKPGRTIFTVELPMP